MRVNCDRKYLSARILHYAANKIWILTTMASFISKSPGDNHVSCFPDILPVQSTVEGWSRQPQARRARSLSILGDGGTPRGFCGNNRAAPGARQRGRGCGDRGDTCQDTGNNLGNSPLLEKQTKPNPEQTQLKSPTNSTKRAIFRNVKHLDFAPEYDI